LVCVVLALVFASIPGARATEGLRNADGSWRYTNRLADETSPYLLLHAHNPVDWYPWGPEALELAQREQRPIFLSVGYSTCYWCHVMEREVFSDPDIAAIMNRWFVNVKVDREERPDLDGYYMTATQLMTQGGGWPNSVFLTPDLDPFYAGTYFPPEDARGRPGFPRVLAALHNAWEELPEKVQASAERATEAIRKVQSGAAATDSTTTLDESLLVAATDGLKASYDTSSGGFGGAPKFPSESELDLLLARYERTGEAELLTMVTHTLTEMARGGIHDHLAGGFHRYATDARWRVPHFEKMLYNQAQLAVVYARAYRITGDAAFRQVTEDIFGFVATVLTSPEGAFYSALDSETHAEEGKSYLWTERQIHEVVGEDGDEFLELYGLERMLEGDGRVLFLRAAPRQATETPTAVRIAAMADGRDAMLAVRDRRDQPLLDTKVLAAWNGMMIRAYAYAAEALDEPRYLATASRAAEFVYGALRDGDGRLQRTYRLGRARHAAYQEDYAFLASAFLELWRVSGDASHLERARTLTDEMLALFWDDEGGGLFFTADAGDLGFRTKDPYDSAIPSGNSEAAHVLLALGQATGEDAYLAKAGALLNAFAAPMAGYSRSFTRMLGAADTYLAMVAAGQVTLPVLAPDPLDAEYVSVTVAGPTAPVPRGGEFDVVVTVSVVDGWHINANPASDEFFVPTSISTSGADGSVEVVDVQYPVGSTLESLISESPLRVYEGDVTLHARLRLSRNATAGEADVALSLAYQVCDDSRCLAPASLEFTVPVRVAAD
jgi:uncharacterized protein YyaL (SSP411 family)